jgi:RNA polymerase sigma-70 factor, ECF subfamily
MNDSDSPSLPCLSSYHDYLLVLVRDQVNQRLQSKLDPSDLVQDTLLKAHRALGSFRGRTHRQLAAWLRSILATTLANAVRAFGRQKIFSERPLARALDESASHLEDLLADHRLTPDQDATRKEELLRLAVALTHLPEAQRTVLEMKYLREYAASCVEQGRGRYTFRHACCRDPLLSRPVGPSFSCHTPRIMYLR